jgi:hypothetical protein
MQSVDAHLPGVPTVSLARRRVSQRLVGPPDPYGNLRSTLADQGDRLLQASQTLVEIAPLHPVAASFIGRVAVTHPKADHGP